jgi:hypothetical protein
MITGSGLGASRLPQNLGSGQKMEDHPTILGVRRQPQKCRKGVSYTRRRSTTSVV